MNYESVPNIITVKDLDYLSDMFNWNYAAYKNAVNAIDNVTDEQIRIILAKATDMFYNNMNVVINILNDGVNNDKTKVPTGKKLNDKDYINCLLSSLKEMVKSYALALTEVSNKNLYNSYKSMFDNYSLLQREVYELMFRNGWYSLEKAEIQKISNKVQMLNQEITDLG